jgi:hypothetical protein
VCLPRLFVRELISLWTVCVKSEEYRCSNEGVCPTSALFGGATVGACCHTGPARYVEEGEASASGVMINSVWCEELPEDLCVGTGGFYAGSFYMQVMCACTCYIITSNFGDAGDETPCSDPAELTCDALVPACSPYIFILSFSLFVLSFLRR